MAARTLFSDSQSLLVARVLNNSLKPKTLSANSLLSMAEPVQCLPGTGCEPSDSLSADGNAWCDSSLSDESALLVSPGLQPEMVSTDETELLASSVSAATSDVLASDSSTSPSGDQLEHIDSLLCSLPLDLTPDQRECAETFICSYANVFSKSEYYIGCTNIIPHRIDTGDSSPHFEQLQHHPTAQLPVIDEHVQHMLEHDVIEPAALPWCSNVVMVRKQDGTM